MRIRISLDLTNKKIPVNYRSLIQGVIYNCLFADKNSKQIHDYGYKLEKRKFKLFTFSELYGNAKYDSKTKELLFLSDAYFEVSAYDENLILAIINFITQNRKIIILNEKVSILSVSFIDENGFDDTMMEFITSSPITVYNVTDDKKTNYFHPTSLEFCDGIIKNLSKKYYLIYGENMPEIKIESITNFKQKRVYFRKNFSIAYHCNIKISGLTNKIYRVVITCGLGSKNSSGFGMVRKK